MAGRCLVGVLLVTLVAWIGLRLDAGQLPIPLVLIMVACFVAAMVALVNAASREKDPEGTNVIYPPMPSPEPLGTLPTSSSLEEKKTSSPTCRVCGKINAPGRYFCQNCQTPMSGPIS
ncbi:MAG TPA: hypothetical protein VK694_02135 [Verrucomicrobiae bacterium]|nr:hypothetical protein [Verrucomicrobiae bacterium]